MPKTWWVTGPVRFAEVSRAVADAARQLDSLEDVRSVVYDAVQQRACTVDQLIIELNDGPCKRSSLLRMVLTEAADGVRSGAEADFRLDRDRDRHDKLIAYGVFPLHFSPRRIRREGEKVLAEIASALENGLLRPRLSIVARPVDAD